MIIEVKVLEHELECFVLLLLSLVNIDFTKDFSFGQSMQMIIKELGVKEIISYEMFFMCSKYTEFVSLFIIVTIFILHVRTTWTHFYCLNFRWVIFTRSWFEHFRLNIKRWNTKVSDFCDFTKIMRMIFRFNIKKYIIYEENHYTLLMNLSFY